MILTDDEIDALWTDEPSVPQRIERRELMRIAQTTILRKLATMSVELAAARVQGMDEYVPCYSKPLNKLLEPK